MDRGGFGRPRRHPLGLNPRPGNGTSFGFQSVCVEIRDHRKNRLNGRGLVKLQRMESAEPVRHGGT